MGMTIGGRRNKLGSLHGPRHEANVNGTHPAICALLQTNSDVQIPYRFTTTPDTHDDDVCKDGCVENCNNKAVLEAVQCSQDAQVGYTCDYQKQARIEILQRSQGVHQGPQTPAGVCC